MAYSMSMQTNDTKTTELPAFKISYDDGSTSTTSMAKGVTLEDAKAYFIGKTFEITEYTFRTAVEVESI